MTDSLWAGLLSYDPPLCRNPECATHFPAGKTEMMPGGTPGSREAERNTT